MTNPEDREKKKAPPAREHRGQARQAGKTSGLASELDWLAVSREGFDEPWYDKIIGTGDDSDKATKLEEQKAVALSLFITGVTSMLGNCSVYFDFDFGAGSFSSGVLALFRLGDSWYNANYVTSHISYGLDKTAMQREINNVVHAVSTELGLRTFTSTIKPIPDKLIKIVKRVEK